MGLIRFDILVAKGEIDFDFFCKSRTALSIYHIVVRICEKYARQKINF